MADRRRHEKDTSSTPPLVLAEMESFYAGGEIEALVTDHAGPDQHVVNAIYVQRLVPSRRTFPYPVVFIHGGFHAGVTWETTPDGREGWQTRFVRGGFETLVVDQAWRGRSAPVLRSIDPVSGAPADLPRPYTGGLNLARYFERGGGRFPFDALERYGAQLWPDFGLPDAFALGRPGRGDPRTHRPLCDLIDERGPVVLVTHSQGCDVGWKLAVARRELVRAIVAIEPGTMPGDLGSSDFPTVPTVIVMGDNLPDRDAPLSAHALRVAQDLAATRPHIELDHLPAAGITGNGHMMMMEDNSHELASRAMRWLRAAIG